MSEDTLTPPSGNESNPVEPQKPGSTGLAQRFHTLFLGLERAHGLWVNGERQANNKIKGKARTVTAPVTDELWERHLKGEIGIGIVAVNDDGLCRWGAIDIDSYDGLDHAALEQQVKDMEVPLLVLRSKSGGAHLYLFTSEPVQARLIQQRLKECALALGQPSAEVFPKQTQIDGEAGVGNWINMPYHNSVVTTRYCVFGGRALEAEEFLDLAESRRITAAALKELKPKAHAAGEEWTEAPPCLEYLVAAGFPQGSRNNALFSLAVYAKRRYPDDGAWQGKVAEYNQRWMAGGWEEVGNIVKSMTKKDYQYKCSDVPLCNHCNKALCVTRKFGIAPEKKRGRPHSGEDAPCVLDEVDRPVKVFRPPEGSGDEPQWVFAIGGKRMDVTLDMIMNQKAFLREYAKRFERVRLEVPVPRWMESVNILLAEAEVLELPPDAGPEGQLMLHLEAFCTGKAAAQDRNELLVGRPWTDADDYTGKGAGLTWFRSKDFVKFCDQQHFRSFKEKEMWAVFRRHGGQNHHFQLKGKCVAAWGFPAFAQQTEDFDAVTVPDAEGEEF